MTTDALVISQISLALNFIVIAAMAYAIRSLAQRVRALENEKVQAPPSFGTQLSKGPTASSVSPEVIAIISAAIAAHLDKDTDQLEISSIKQVT